MHEATEIPPMPSHEYRARVVWDGTLGAGTATWAGYSRDHRVHIDGKPDLLGSANPIFRGDPGRHDPEDLFLSAIASCHMLAYLALCARNGVKVVAYEDEAEGTLVLDPRGGGRFEQVTLRPVVTVAAGDPALAVSLHDVAHAQCFIASSCRVPIRHEPRVQEGA